MTKPAPKEPSMDEILSSIRQIIADDDAGAAPRRPTPAPAAAAPRPQAAAPAPAAKPEPAPEVPSWDALLPSADDIGEPLALSPDQMLPPEGDTGGDPTSALNFDTFLADSKEDDSEAPAPELVDPDDIAFDLDAAAAEAQPAEEEVEPMSFSMAPEPEAPGFELPEDDLPQPPRHTWAAAPEPEPEPELPEAVAEPEWDEPVMTESPASRASVAQSAPMPDATLSADMAEQLLEPATNAAVRQNFARLNQLQIGTPGLTVEAMLREMLRPMLKEWLDENLPTMVERMVEREISRIARGE